jgi:hypothetical protein
VDEQLTATLCVIEALELRLRETFGYDVPNDLILLLRRLEATVFAHAG